MRNYLLALHQIQAAIEIFTNKKRAESAASESLKILNHLILDESIPDEEKHYIKQEAGKFYSLWICSAVKALGRNEIERPLSQITIDPVAFITHNAKSKDPDLVISVLRSSLTPEFIISSEISGQEPFEIILLKCDIPGADEIFAHLAISYFKVLNSCKIHLIESYPYEYMYSFCANRISRLFRRFSATNRDSFFKCLKRYESELLGLSCLKYFGKYTDITTDIALSKAGLHKVGLLFAETSKNSSGITDDLYIKRHDFFGIQVNSADISTIEREDAAKYAFVCYLAYDKGLDLDISEINFEYTANMIESLSNELDLSESRERIVDHMIPRLKDDHALVSFADWYCSSSSKNEFYSQKVSRACEILLEKANDPISILRVIAVARNTKVELNMSQKLTINSDIFAIINGGQMLMGNIDCAAKYIDRAVLAEVVCEGLKRREIRADDLDRLPSSVINCSKELKKIRLNRDLSL